MVARLALGQDSHAAVAGRGSRLHGQVGPWQIPSCLLLYQQWDSDNSDGDSDNYEAYPLYQV